MNRAPQKCQPGLRFFFGEMLGVTPCSVSMLRILLLSYPRSPIRVSTFGRSLSRTSAPLKSLHCPSVRWSLTGRPRLSHEACSFVFRPPLVRPVGLRWVASLIAPFLRLEGAWWAFRWVASIIRTLPSSPCGLANSSMMRLNTPFSDHRLNRLHSVLVGPYTVGASVHCSPFSMT